MVEAVGWVMEVFVGEQVNVDAVLSFIDLGNLGIVKVQKEAQTWWEQIGEVKDKDLWEEWQ